jgi:hypothetical protein
MATQAKRMELETSGMRIQNLDLSIWAKLVPIVITVKFRVKMKNLFTLYTRQK